MEIAMNMPKPQREAQEEDIRKYYDLFRSTSHMVWSYFDYTGYLTPWHELSNAVVFISRSKKKFAELIQTCKDEDMDLKTTLFLTCALAPYYRYNKAAYLFLEKNSIARLKKLRRYVQTDENYKFIGEFLKRFFTLQVELYGAASINEKTLTEKTDKGIIYLSLHKMADRIEKLKQQKIMPMEWLRIKAEKAHKAFPDQRLFFNTIVNENGLDPSNSEVIGIITDEWFEIRRFLGVSDKCVFPDGYIPKGWVPATNDEKQNKRIVKITGNGFSYFDDGTQRRGFWHYQKNKYLTIKCDPSNFQYFQKFWKDEKLRKSYPMWEEYANWSLYPGLWNEEGTPNIPSMKIIKWRKKRRK